MDEKTSPNSSTRKRTIALPEAVEKHLSGYAAAAGAAGVALLAFTVPAEARVIAKEANVSIPINGGVIQFDINGDGQNDFGLSAQALGGCTSTTSAAIKGKHLRGPRQHPPLGCPFDDRVNVIPAQAADEVWKSGSFYGGGNCAADIGGGVKIGAARPFAGGKMAMAIHSGTSEGRYSCAWAGSSAPRPYLAVKFTDTSGNVHFGWVRVTVNFAFLATVTGYGYETVPNRPILAGATRGADEHSTLVEPQDLTPLRPEVASLGVLAQGASGLSAWRREEELTAR